MVRCMVLVSSMLGQVRRSLSMCFFFFFNDTATTEIYTLSLHDALPIRGATGLIVCPDLVQREKPLAVLLDQLGAAAQGQSRFVALTGEAGVGKSRLVRELARIAHEDGFYVFGGRSHASAATPYEPFVAALRPYV